MWCSKWQKQTIEEFNISGSLKKFWPEIASFRASRKKRLLLRFTNVFVHHKCLLVVFYWRKARHFCSWSPDLNNLHFTNLDGSVKLQVGQRNIFLVFRWTLLWTLNWKLSTSINNSLYILLSTNVGHPTNY